ncbi:hypothetical protein [uncultured Dokdonia sp.]|uniref:hypothetical protein n=1 Tax=uncultured Dokdonia sp. TaxID=575653 RepID=UPI00262CB1B6|nr:hypothetical protein [uncultured Dokdonia sp.]
MKYISLIDELGITVHTIQSINAARIEQLKKQLEFEEILNSDIKVTEHLQLINQLEDPTIREATIFIERHPWLKKILLENYKELDSTSFDSTYDPRAIASHTKTYIAPFLQQTLSTTLSYLLQERKLELLARTVSQKRFFSEEVQQEITSFFATQINQAKNYIVDGKLKTSQEPVSFLHHADFVESINMYLEPLTDEVTEMNSAIIRVYNLNQSARNTEWGFAIAVMIAFGKLSFSNSQQQEVFKKNASMATTSKFKPDRVAFNTPNSQSNNSKGTYIIIAFVAVIFIAIIATIPFINRNSSTDYYYEDDSDISIEEHDNENQQDSEYTDSDASTDTKEEELEETATDITELLAQPTEEDTTTEEKPQRTVSDEYITLPNQSKRNTQDSHIRFFYNLKNKVTKGDDNEAIEIIRVTPFTNPYPKTFNTIEEATDKNDNTQLEIVNNTQKELIIFKLQDGIDEAIIIPKAHNAALNFKQGDSIAFYAGNDFTSSRFSHFTREQDISNIYKINTLSTSSKIEVSPFKDNSGSAKNAKYHRSIESLKLYNLETKKLKPIESLYRDFYNAYYGK